MLACLLVTVRPIDEKAKHSLPSSCTALNYLGFENNVGNDKTLVPRIPIIKVQMAVEQTLLDSKAASSASGQKCSQTMARQDDGFSPSLMLPPEDDHYKASFLNDGESCKPGIRGMGSESVKREREREREREKEREKEDNGGDSKAHRVRGAVLSTFFFFFWFLLACALLFPLPLSPAFEIQASLYTVIGLSVFISVLLVTIVGEKEKKLLEGMRIVGLTYTAYYFAWFLTYAALMLFTCIAMTVVGFSMKTITYRLVEYSQARGVFGAYGTVGFLCRLMNGLDWMHGSSIPLVVLMYYTYCLALIPFAFWLSTILNNARGAATIGSFCSIVSSLVYTLLNNAGAPKALQVFISLFAPPIALSSCLDTMYKLEVCVWA